jgi:Dna[CI] antecedent, DciA
VSSNRRRRYRREPIAVGDRLARFRGGAGAPAGSDLALLQRAWVDVAGAQAAGQSVVVRRSRAGVITIACASAGWAQDLDARRESLTSQLDRAAGELAVSGIRFVVGDHVIPQAETTRTVAPPTPTPAERTRAEGLFAEVADVELRERLVRAAAGQMAVSRASQKTPANRQRRDK